MASAGGRCKLDSFTLSRSGSQDGETLMGRTPSVFPPPERPPRSRIGDLPNEFEAEPSPVGTPDLLMGRWTTSYSGWMHFDPRPTAQEPPIGAPPQFSCVGFDQAKQQFFQREGYFAFAALACYTFDGFGRLTGIRDLNQGGPRHLEDTPLTGDYVLGTNTDLQIYKGAFRVRHMNQVGYLVDNFYNFVVRTPDELEWVWIKGTYQKPGVGGTFTEYTETVKLDDGTTIQVHPAFWPLVTHGVLKRVTVWPPLA